MNKYDLSNKVAIVTGGAQGFGLAITKKFLDSGAEVIIWDIDKEATELVGSAAARLGRAEGMEAHARTADIRLKKYGYLK